MVADLLLAGAVHTAGASTCLLTTGQAPQPALRVYGCAQVDPKEQAPELTHRLFKLGSKMLLQHLPAILLGKSKEAAVPQAQEQATHAAKAGLVRRWVLAMTRVWRGRSWQYIAAFKMRLRVCISGRGQCSYHAAEAPLTGTWASTGEIRSDGHQIVSSA